MHIDIKELAEAIVDVLERRSSVRAHLEPASRPFTRAHRGGDSAHVLAFIEKDPQGYHTRSSLQMRGAGNWYELDRALEDLRAQGLVTRTTGRKGGRVYRLVQGPPIAPQPIPEGAHQKIVAAILKETTPFSRSTIVRMLAGDKEPLRTWVSDVVDELTGAGVLRRSPMSGRYEVVQMSPTTSSGGAEPAK